MRCYRIFLKDAPTVRNEATIAATWKERQNNFPLISTEPENYKKTSQHRRASKRPWGGELSLEIDTISIFMDSAWTIVYARLWNLYSNFYSYENAKKYQMMIALVRFWGLKRD